MGFKTSDPERGGSPMMIISACDAETSLGFRLSDEWISASAEARTG